MNLVSELFDLTGQVAFVTGASSGMGRRMAALLARHGASVAVAARSVDKLATLVEEIAALGRKAVAVPLDVSEVTAVAPAVAAAEAALGPVDILINNAGVAYHQRAVKATAALYDEMMNVNLRGPYFLASEIGRRMIERGQGGRILNISSSSGLKPMAGYSAYSTSKAALIHLTRVLALEWASHQINVNAICPGYVLSDMTSAVDATEIGRKMRETLPRKRIGAPEDLDCMVLAMVAPTNRFTTGAVVAVDDGISVS
jgi:3-oxoacyl-[acyl-carrier protein] reductase